MEKDKLREVFERFQIYNDIGQLSPLLESQLGNELLEDVLAVMQTYADQQTEKLQLTLNGAIDATLGLTTQLTDLKRENDILNRKLKVDLVCIECHKSTHQLIGGICNDCKNKV